MWLLDLSGQRAMLRSMDGKECQRLLRRYQDNFDAKPEDYRIYVSDFVLLQIRPLAEFVSRVMRTKRGPLSRILTCEGVKDPNDINLGPGNFRYQVFQGRRGKAKRERWRAWPPPRQKPGEVYCLFVGNIFLDGGYAVPVWIRTGFPRDSGACVCHNAIVLNAAGTSETKWNEMALLHELAHILDRCDHSLVDMAQPGYRPRKLVGLRADYFCSYSEFNTACTSAEYVLLRRKRKYSRDSVLAALRRFLPGMAAWLANKHTRELFHKRLEEWEAKGLLVKQDP